MHRKPLPLLSLLAALCLSLPALALTKSIPIFQGEITEFELVTAEQVNLSWNPVDFGPAPTLGEGESFVVVTVLLAKGRSISKYDFDLRAKGEDLRHCLATRSDRAAAFNPDRTDGTWIYKNQEEVQLLYTALEAEEYELKLRYKMNALPYDYQVVTVDLRAPVVAPPPAADGAPAAMPEDFALAWLTNANEPLDLNGVKTDDTTFVQEGKFVTVLEGADAVAGLNGFGLEVAQEGETLMWTPAPMALYRDKALIGTFDPTTQVFTAADPSGTVPLELKLPGDAAAEGDAAPDAAADGAGDADAPADAPAAPVKPAVTEAAPKADTGTPKAEPAKTEPAKTEPAKPKTEPAKPKDDKKEAGGTEWGW